MTAADTLAKLKAHLAKHGFADLEVNMSGGYDPTPTDPGATLNIPKSWPRSAVVAALDWLLARLCIH
jgi:hypothetical protein